MKILSILAAAGLAALTAAPAMAQPSNPLSDVSGYANLGYSNFDDHSNTSAINGRLGGRFAKYFGVEGELALGLSNSGTHVGGLDNNVRLHDEYAGYAVGYLPVLPNADLFARVGYGASDAKVWGQSGQFNNYREGLAYGAGGQYFFSGPNGVRLDYTRMEYGPTVGDSNVWSLGYVRKF